MKRQAIRLVSGLIIILMVGSGPAFAQSVFKIPFKFEAGDRKLPPGEYRISRDNDGLITLSRVSGGEEYQLPFKKKLAQPETPIEGPQIVFDMVGNFEPSYTEYITDYLLSEVWLSPQDGYLLLETEGEHDHKIIKEMNKE